MIKIKSSHKGLKTGAMYYLKQDGNDIYLLHVTSGNGIKTTLDRLKEIDYEYIPELELAM